MKSIKHFTTKSPPTILLLAVNPVIGFKIPPTKTSLWVEISKKSLLFFSLASITASNLLKSTCVVPSVNVATIVVSTLFSNFFSKSNAAAFSVFITTLQFVSLSP